MNMDLIIRNKAYGIYEKTMKQTRICHNDWMEVIFQ